MGRLNGWACLEVFVVLAFYFTLSEPAMSQTSLETVCGIYQQHTPENFDDCGEISHYVWKNFASFFCIFLFAKVFTLLTEKMTKKRREIFIVKLTKS